MYKEREKMSEIEDAKKMDYDRIWAFYEMKELDSKKKKDIKKTLKKRLKKQFSTNELDDLDEKEQSPTPIWNNLSEVEQQYFIYVSIRDYMFEKIQEYFVNDYENKIERIKQKIEKESNDLFSVLDVYKNQKEKVEIAFKIYCKATDHISTKQFQYGKICADLKKYWPHIPEPDLSEWIEHPLRIYDYVMSYKDYVMSYKVHEMDSIDFYPSQKEVDHVILQIIMQYLEKEHGLKINIPLIKECLHFMNLVDIDEFEVFPTKDRTKTENPYTQWIKYSNMLQQLTPFYDYEHQK